MNTDRSHLASCASFCTNNNGVDHSGPCQYEANIRKHECWCADGNLSYAEYQTKHPSNPDAPDS